MTSPARGSAPPSDPPGYAHELYANLRRLDAARADEILIEALPNDDAWLALRETTWHVPPRAATTGSAIAPGSRP